MIVVGLKCPRFAEISLSEIDTNSADHRMIISSYCWIKISIDLRLKISLDHQINIIIMLE